MAALVERCESATIDEICAFLHNYFPIEIHEGEFTIDDGEITLPFLSAGQFFRIVGSVSNDGVYRYGEYPPKDETFTGAVWVLAIPPALEAIALEIERWEYANAEASTSPYQSESFGGYSYTKAQGVNSWRGVFASRLNRWRKI